MLSPPILGIREAKESDDDGLSYTRLLSTRTLIVRRLRTSARALPGLIHFAKTGLPRLLPAQSPSGKIATLRLVWGDGVVHEVRKSQSLRFWRRPLRALAERDDG